LVFPYKLLYLLFYRNLCMKIVNKCVNVLSRFFRGKKTNWSFLFIMSIRRSFQNVFSRFLTSEWTNKIPANVRHFFHPASGQPQRSPKPYTIIVEGNIGSGKTTFLEPFTKSHQDQVSISRKPFYLSQRFQPFRGSQCP